MINKLKIPLETHKIYKKVNFHWVDSQWHSWSLDNCHQEKVMVNSANGSGLHTFYLVLSFDVSDYKSSQGNFIIQLLNLNYNLTALSSSIPVICHIVCVRCIQYGDAIDILTWFVQAKLTICNAPTSYLLIFTNIHFSKYTS